MRLDNIMRAGAREGYPSYRTFAAYLGISPSMLCYVVTGRRDVGAKVFRAFRDRGLLERYSVTWLLAPTDKPEREAS